MDHPHGAGDVEVDLLLPLASASVTSVAIASAVPRDGPYGLPSASAPFLLDDSPESRLLSWRNHLSQPPYAVSRPRAASTDAGTKG